MKKGKVKRKPRTGEGPNKKFAPDMRITLAMPYKHIVHGIPGVSRYTLERFHQMAEVTAKAGYEVFTITNIATSNTPITRTQIVNGFEGDWLLMMDADAFPESDTCNKLLLAAKEDPKNLKKIIAAPAVRPSYPHFATFGNVMDSGLFIPCRYGVEFGDDEIDAVETTLMEVGGTGFHCILIHKSVFRAVPYPWFPLNVKDEDTGLVYGHDYSFCRTAKRLGFISYVDFSCRVGHYGLMPFTLAHNRAILQANPQEMEQQRHLGVDVEELLEEEDSTMNYPLEVAAKKHLTQEEMTKIAERAQNIDFIPKEAL